MNVTMLSQMVWAMFLDHHCLPKAAKNCQKMPKVDFQVGNLLHGCMVSKDKDTATIS